MMAVVGDFEVRRATVDDVSALAEMTARAFYDDPLVSWFLPDDDDRLHRATKWFAATFKGALKHHEVHTTSQLVGAAVWAAPGEWNVPLRKALPVLPATIRWLGSGFSRFVKATNALAASHPSEPHWYLEGLGTDPPWQRQGVGTALITPILERCDREGLPSYLETQKEANVAYYRRHRFDVVKEIDLPGGGPHMWLMWRPAAG
jgi:GNAT superfamily N-acetyltransferase